MVNQEDIVLLLDEPSLQVQPKLAQALGLNQALFLQQVQFWLYVNKKNGRNLRDGRYWTYNTFEAWQREQFPFWSVSTLKRIVAKLERSGVLLTTTKYNKAGYDNTKWYSIDRDRLEQVIVSGELSESTPQVDEAIVQNDTVVPEETEPSCQSDTTTVSKWNDTRANLTRPIPDTNTETNTESTREGDSLRSSPALEKPSKHRSKDNGPPDVSEAVQGAVAKSQTARQNKSKRKRAAPKNANIATKYFAEKFIETFGGVAPLELAKDRALMKKLIDHYGYDQTIEAIDWMFRNWAQFRRECSLTGVSTVGLLFGFRTYLMEKVSHREVVGEKDNVWGV